MGSTNNHIFESDQNKINKLAFKAGVWYIISNILVKSIAFITTPLFTRLMSTDEYGDVQTFISWYALLLPVFTLNLAYSVGRAKLDYPDKLDEYIGSMQLLSMVFSAAVTAIILIFIGPISKCFELSVLETILLFIYLCFAPAITFYQDGYRYRYEYKQNIGISWYTVLSTTVLSIILIFALSGSKADSMIIGLVIPTLVLSIYFWIKSFKNKTIVYNSEYWKYGLKISLPLIFHNISLHILAQSDRIIIAKVWGKTDTAFYSLAYTYGSLLHVFTNAAADGWLPWFHDTYFSKRFDVIRKKVKPLVILVCYIGLAAVAFAPEAIFILGGSRYANSLMCVPPIVIGVVCQHVYTHYVNIEMHLKKTLYVAYGTIFVAVMNLVLNIIFIPRYGFIAAAYTTLVGYFSLLIIHFLVTRVILKVKLYDDLFMFGSVFVTAAISVGIVFTYDHTLLRYTVILIGFISCVIYFRDYIREWMEKRHQKGKDL